nr:unnamed protein product [Callosobruchus analis]
MTLTDEVLGTGTTKQGELGEKRGNKGQPSSAVALSLPENGIKGDNKKSLEFLQDVSDINSLDTQENYTLAGEVNMSDPQVEKSIQSTSTVTTPLRHRVAPEISVKDIIASLIPYIETAVKNAVASPVMKPNELGPPLPPPSLPPPNTSSGRVRSDSASTSISATSEKRKKQDESTTDDDVSSLVKVIDNDTCICCEVITSKNSGASTSNSSVEVITTVPENQENPQLTYLKNILKEKDTLINQQSTTIQQQNILIQQLGQTIAALNSQLATSKTQQSTYAAATTAHAPSSRKHIHPEQTTQPSVRQDCPTPTVSTGSTSTRQAVAQTNDVPKPPMPPIASTGTVQPTAPNTNANITGGSRYVPPDETSVVQSAGFQMQRSMRKRVQRKSLLVGNSSANMECPFKASNPPRRKSYIQKKPHDIWYIIIESDLSVSIFLNGVNIVVDSLPAQVNNITEIDYILESCLNINKNERRETETVLKIIDKLLKTIDVSEDNSKIIPLIISQITLCTESKNHHKFEPEFIIIASILNSISPNCPTTS